MCTFGGALEAGEERGVYGGVVGALDAGVDGEVLGAVELGVLTGVETWLGGAVDGVVLDPAELHAVIVVASSTVAAAMRGTRIRATLRGGGRKAGKAHRKIVTTT